MAGRGFARGSGGGGVALALPPLLVLLLMLLLVRIDCARAEIGQRASAQAIEGAEGATGGPSAFSSAAESWRKECGKAYSTTCFKLDVVSFVDRLAEQEDLGILPGVSVVKQNGSVPVPTADVVANLARDFPNDADKRMDAYLMHKIGSYLNSHAISIRLFDPRTFEAARSFNEEALEQLGFGEQHHQQQSQQQQQQQHQQQQQQRGGAAAETGRRKGDKGGMNSMMAGLMMMKGTLGALGFGALAMLAGKALMTGLMALMLSAIVGLKSLAGGGEKKTTYEIVSKPVYTSTHTHSTEDVHAHGGYSGYGRSMNEAAETVQEALKKYGNVRDRRTVR